MANKNVSARATCEYFIAPAFHAQAVRNIINRVMVEAGLFGPVWGRALDAFANIDVAYDADCSEVV